MENLKVGTVKWFNDEKGYGFIARDEGDDVFFHYSAIEKQGYKTIDDDSEVEFELENGPKGPKATRVIPSD